MDITQQIVKTLVQFLNKETKPISLHEPHFAGNEWNYIKECLDTGWVSSVGKFVDKFEHDLCDFTGAKYAIATVNGTAALHISYLLSQIHPGDEVLVPTLTFVGTINPIAYCGAIPHFLDADERTLGINPEMLDHYLHENTLQKNNVCINKFTGRIIRALCVMHSLGHPVDLDPLEEICHKYSITLIEDAAEALGSYYKGVHVGHRGLLGALSFNGNKIISTGGGGAILTNDPKLAKLAKHMTTTAKLPHAWLFDHDQVGYNYRLPNLNAALGCAQLEMLPKFIKAKRVLAQRYKEAFSSINEVEFIKEPAFAKSNYWLNAIILDRSFADCRDKILSELSQKNIMARPLWNLQNSLSMWENAPRMSLPVATSLYQRLIKLPSSSHLMMSTNDKILEENYYEKT